VIEHCVGLKHRVAIKRCNPARQTHPWLEVDEGDRRLARARLRRTLRLRPLNERRVVA
jgi:hypothetical protein